MIQKCIMVKIWGSKKRKLGQKTSNERNNGGKFDFGGNTGKFINVAEMTELTIS